MESILSVLGNILDRVWNEVILEKGLVILGGWAILIAAVMIAGGILYALWRWVGKPLIENGIDPFVEKIRTKLNLK